MIAQRNAVVVLALVAAHAAVAQQPIPLRQLAPAEAVSKDTVGFLYGVRELSTGRLLVNDAGGRRLLLFDRALAAFDVVADSASASESPYGKRPTGIIPYHGDTTLLVDVTARAFVVYGPDGKVTGVMSPPRANDVTSMGNPSFGAPRLDPKDRLLYRGSMAMAFKAPEPGKPFVAPELPDTVPILRADFDTRRADTLAWIRVPKIKIATTPLEGGGVTMRPLLNPLAFIDDWTALPDGSIAILRGADYHIDWINADGTRVSSPKMRFDWRRLSDEDKATIVDSTKTALARSLATGGTAGLTASLAALDHGGGAANHSMTIVPVGGNDGGPAPRSAAAAPIAAGTPEVVPPADLPDYMPPIMSSGVMRADHDGNVWILPSTSAQAGGGLLYDVINRRGEIFERVRIPPGRALVGFGRGGAVYLTFRDASGTHLERARLQ